MNEDRYSRHILFPGIGRTGQERLRRSRVLIIGCGALGSAQAEMLARAGVGFLRVVDRDFLEVSNLHRQILFDERDAADRLPKAIACARRLARVNSDVQVEALPQDVTPRNIERLIAGVDLVLDGTDNFETRYLINDACVKHGTPWIYGAAVGSYGLTMTIRPGFTPCLRCVFEKMPPPGSSPTCDTAGIILPIVLIIASIQVTEALKLLTGQIEKLHGGLIHVDVWETTFHRVTLTRLREKVRCPACTHRRFEFLEGGARPSALSLCGRNAVHISGFGEVTLDLAQIAERLKPLGEVTLTEFLLVFRVNGYELNLFADGRCIIKGTEDMAIARSLYARYIGL